MNSLIIKKCIVGTLPLGLAGSGTNKFSALTLENLKYRPLDDARSIAFLMIRLSDRYGVESFNKAEIQKYCTGGWKTDPLCFFVLGLRFILCSFLFGIKASS